MQTVTLNRPRCFLYYIMERSVQKRGSQGNAVGIATGYGLSDQRFKAWRRRDLLCPTRPAQRPFQPPMQWVPGLTRG